MVERQVEREKKDSGGLLGVVDWCVGDSLLIVEAGSRGASQDSLTPTRPTPRTANLVAISPFLRFDDFPNLAMAMGGGGVFWWVLQSVERGCARGRSSGSSGAAAYRRRLSLRLAHAHGCL